MTDETRRSISLRTAGSSFKNLMNIKHLGWKADRSEYMEILFSLYYQCKKNCSRPKEAACLAFVSSKGCYMWFSSWRLSSALRGVAELRVCTTLCQCPRSLQPSHWQAVTMSSKAAGLKKATFKPHALILTVYGPGWAASAALAPKLFGESPCPHGKGWFWRWGAGSYAEAAKPLRAHSSQRVPFQWEFAGIWLNPLLAHWGSGAGTGPRAGQGSGKSINSGTLLALSLCAENWLGYTSLAHASRVYCHAHNISWISRTALQL